MAGLAGSPNEVGAPGSVAPGAEAIGLPRLTGTGAEVLDALALFLRTVPLYPAGHGRTEAAAARLVEAVARHGESVVLQTIPEGLRVGDALADPKSPWAKAVREALTTTAVVRVTFAPTTTREAYEAFARRLHRNGRLASTGGVSFKDLWGEAIEGILVEEQVYDREYFTVVGEAGPGAAVNGRATRAPSPGAGPARGTAGRAPSKTLSSDLRSLAREHPFVGALLVRLQAAILERQGGSSDGSMDLLEHVIRLLPLEARLDPTKGLRLVERILERFAETLVDEQPAVGSRRQAVLLLRAMTEVFPVRALGAKGLPIPEAAEEGPTDLEGLSFEELSKVAVFSEFPPDVNLRELAPPNVDGETGIDDPAAMTLHILGEVEPGPRRDALRSRLVDRLKRHPEEAPCLVRHLKEAVLVPPTSRNLDRIGLLAGVVEEAGKEYAASAVSGWVTPEHVVAMFPRLFTAFVAAGGDAGAICRAVGRTAVLAAAQDLLAPGAILHPTGLLDRMLADRRRDVLPLLEVTLSVREPTRRTAAVRALRTIDLPCVAAAALRVVPEDRLTDRLLSGLCEDGFSGADTRRFDSDAVAAIATVVTGDRLLEDLTQRVYAVAALGSFPPSLVVPLLHSLLERKMLVWTHPKEVRRAAQDALDRFDRRRREFVA